MTWASRMTQSCVYARALDALEAGGVVAIPTDTVYGLAASLKYPNAIERIYRLKGRQDDKPMPVLVSSLADALRLTSAFPVLALRLAQRFWPGALTIVAPASPCVPTVVLRGGTTVGLRMPDHALALACIEHAGGALAVTSANSSGKTELLHAADVRAVFGDRLDGIVECDAGLGGQPSTVVSVLATGVRILRHGAINPAEIDALLASTS